MEVPQDEGFREQRRAFSFRFTCDACVHFDDRAEACSLEYPPGRHLAVYYENPAVDLCFCKEFDLR